ncbi:hypothetical protein [Streptomyces stelliscabiei]|uniref:hypothetical protein n=1 Tax=Streptomyces stelliscabiei TaxID=146820 RepID=UPI002FF1417F
MASFSDDFSRPDSSDLGADWVEVSGDWSIVSNQLSPGAAGGTIILRAADPMASDDNFAQVTIAATALASQGVWCRGNTNISSGYLWRNDGTSWDLFSVVGGSFTLIGSYAAAAAPGDVAKVQAVGSTIKAFVNGVERVSLTNTHVTTGTNVGIRSESAGAIRFDDFAAADVTAGANLTPAIATETAQPLTGTVTAPLGTATATGTGQPLAGGKTTALDTGVTSEAAQQPTGSKTATPGTALETADPQALAEAKTAPLPVAEQTETVQPLVGTMTGSLSAATSDEAAQPLAGGKSATLTPAAETSTARPLAPAGSDEDVAITVGAPHGALYSAGAPQPGRWEVGAPC